MTLPSAGSMIMLILDYNYKQADFSYKLALSHRNSRNFMNYYQIVQISHETEMILQLDGSQ